MNVFHDKYYDIPSAVRTQYPLRSAGSAHDSYEYDDTTGKWSYVQRVGSVDLGTLTWTKSSSSNKYYSNSSTTPNYARDGVLSCAKYTFGGFATSTPWYGDDKTIRAYGQDSANEFYVHDERYTTLESFMEAMDGVELLYKMKAPILTDITELMPSINIINTEPGGLIVFEQEETALPIPTTLILSPWTDITEEANVLALAAQDDAAVAQSSANEARRIAELAAAGVDETQQVIRIETDGLYLYPGKRTDSGIEIDTDGYHQRFTNRSQRVQRSGAVRPDFATSNRVIILGTQAIVQTVDGGTGFRLATIDDYAALGE